MGGEDHTARAADQTGTERRRVTVAEAAEHLGITAEAVRTRIKRGKLDSVKDPPDRTGTVYVLLRADQTRPNFDPTVKGQDRTSDQTATGRGEELADELRDRIRYLERQVEEEREARRRADTLLARLMDRVPELEAPQDASRQAPRTPEGPDPSATPPAESGGPDTPTERPQEERSWWRRMFGGE